MKEENQVFIARTSPVSLDEKISPFDCFHAAFFKYIFRSAKVDFVVFTLTLVLLKQGKKSNE